MAASAASTRTYDQAADHVLLSSAGPLADADAGAADLLTDDVLHAATATVPDEWLVDEPGFASADAVREAYVEVLRARLSNRQSWLPPLEAARAAI